MSGSWARIATVLLDAGNTLVSIDFDWLAALLAPQGLEVTPEALARAEARARPILSRRLAGAHVGGRLSTESGATFAFYVERILAGLSGVTEERAVRLAPRTARALKAEGNARLWSRVLPGVRVGLEALAALGVGLGVVSNSDGTIHETLRRAGLAASFQAIVDSAVVGFEKPDARIFAHALEALGASAPTTLYVGDLYAVDVVGARAAGLDAALVDPFDDWTGADCPRVADLPDLARRLRAQR
ncbi:MAG: HAD family hydrolase [Thermoanaerobaculia bacterium]